MGEVRARKKEQTQRQREKSQPASQPASSWLGPDLHSGHAPATWEAKEVGVEGSARPAEKPRRGRSVDDEVGSEQA